LTLVVYHFLHDVSFFFLLFFLLLLFSVWSCWIFLRNWVLIEAAVLGRKNFQR
jgi:hypothetical protein